MTKRRDGGKRFVCLDVGGGQDGESGGGCCAKSTKRSRLNAFRSAFWTMIVMLSVVSGGFFLSNNTSEFLSATVQTTLDGSVPLSEVFFPSVVVCNINQIRKSFFAELGFYENDTLVRIMYEDFIKGTIDSERALMNEKDESYVEDPKRSAFYEVGSHTQFYTHAFS